MKGVEDINMLEQYDYFMFVDASGDDGFKFDSGSSSCYVASCLIIHKDDFQHNIDILHKIKYLMGAKQEDEVKHAKLRRNPRRKQIYELLPNVHGSLYSAVAFKKLLDNEMMLNTKTKFLTCLCHMYPIISMQKHFADNPDVNILVVVDRMKEIEMETVKHNVLFYLGKEEYKGNYDVIFKDSKDLMYILLQLADIFAGISREYFEFYETDETVRRIRRLCGMCCKLPNKKICKPHNKQVTHRPFQVILALYRNNPSNSVLTSLMSEPPKCLGTYAFLWCTK